MPEHPSATTGGETLAARAAAAAARTFVGRADEVSAFAEALAQHPAPTPVFYVHGPGGIGKSTLLARFAAMAAASGAAVVSFDGAEIEASPQSFAETVAGAFAGAAGRRVLLVDSMEALRPLEAWLRRVWLPSLPADDIVVLAGRSEPESGWIGEGGIGALCKILPLRDLPPDDAAELLARRGLTSDAVPAVLAAAFGHPLALTLAAEAVRQTGGLGDGGWQGVNRALLQRLVGSAPTPAHRTALELACHVFRTTESLLAEAIGDDAPELFAWLCERPFFDTAADGIFPHDLVREIVESEFRWRDPAGYTKLHRAARQHILGRLAAGDVPERARALRDMVFLHRHNPVMMEYFRFRALGRVLVEPAAAADYPGIAAIVERHEGAASAAIAKHWLARQPGAFFAARDETGALAGFITHLDVSQPDAVDAAADPVLGALQQTLGRFGPREGERVVLDRFNMAADSYQSASPTLTALQIHSYGVWMTTPRLSWTFLATARNVPWADLMAYIDFAPVADVEAAGVALRVFGHDWRQVSPPAWFALMEDRETNADMRPGQLTSAPPELLVLSRPVFDDAVREALRMLHDNAALAASPLIRSQLLAAMPAGPMELRGVILAAADALRRRPQDEKFFRALELTYLNPAGTQEAVAERLGLPFGTYRYRLGIAIERLTAMLWTLETTTANAAE